MQTRRSTAGVRPSIHSPDRSVRQDESLSSSSFIQNESHSSKITSDDDPDSFLTESEDSPMARRRTFTPRPPPPPKKGPTPLPRHDPVIAIGFNRKPLIWGILLAIVLAYLCLRYLSRREPVLSKTEECRNSFRRLKEEHPEQNEMLIRSLFSASNGLSTGAVNSIVLLYKNRTSSSVFINDVISSSVPCTASGQSNPIILHRSSFTQDMELDQGRILATFGEQLKKEGIMLVEDLNRIPESVAVAFHTICDQYQPWAKPAVIFFTLPIPSETVNTELDRLAMNMLKKQWAQLPNNVLDPLVVRITDQVWRSEMDGLFHKIHISEALDLEPVDTTVPEIIYSTALKGFDLLLNGGLPGGTINEFLGNTGSGKSFMLSALALGLISAHDLNVLFITSSETSTISCLRSLARHKRLDRELIDYKLGKIKICEFGDLGEVIAVLKFLVSDGGQSLLKTHKILILDGLASVITQTRMSSGSSHGAHSCVQLLRQVANEYGVVVMLSGLAMTKNEKTADKTKTFLELPDRGWQSLMDNRFFITKSMSLHEHCIFEIELQILKSRSLKTSLSCRLSAMNWGIE